MSQNPESALFEWLVVLSNRTVDEQEIPKICLNQNELSLNTLVKCVRIKHTL